MPTWPAREKITEALEFDLIHAKPNSLHGLASIVLYDGATAVGWVNRSRDSQHSADSFLDVDDEEVQVILKKWRAGGVEVRYGTNLPGVTVDEIALYHWENLVQNPFTPFFGFMENMVHHGVFKDLTHDAPRRFTFPGIVEGANRRYYKRDDDATTPDVADTHDLAGEGWTLDVPWGPHELHAVDVLDAPGAISIGAVQRVYHRRKDETAEIVAIARAWHRYWRNLTSSEQGINDRMTARKHWEHAIGRMWADKPNDDRISVFYAGEATATPRAARDAEDWMLGNAEQWIHEWGGFAAFVLAISHGSNRTLLEAQMDDYTFAHVDEGGSVGDRLSNGADGLVEATWDGYQDTHYPAAVNHGVDGLSVETLTIIVHQGDTETAQLPVTGGLAPHTFGLAVPTPSWASIDASTGEITVSPDTTVTVQDYTLSAKVTDDLGTAANATVTVTVRAEETP